MLRLLPFLLLVLLPVRSFAQFYGAAGLGVTSSSNVSGLDSAVPDIILDPSLLLGYDWNIDHRLKVGFFAGASASQYTSHTERSSTLLYLGATPTYYLLSKGTFFATVDRKDTANVEASTKVESVADRLLKLENWIITVRPKLPKMRRTLDSSQELIGVVRELLSTTSYTTSVKEIVLSELRDQLRALESYRSREIENIVSEWRNLVSQLEATPEESDFLPTEEELDLESEVLPPLPPIASEEDGQLAPLMTLSTTHQRFRNMSASDYYLPQDRGSLNERTIATTFSLPITYTKQTNSDEFENYTNDQLALSLRGSGMPSENVQLAGSIDRIGTTHPLDSVYSNTEWRLRGSGKVVLSESSLLGLELGYGFRTYLNPLSFAVRGQGPVTREVVTVGSEFAQYTLGAWYQHFLSEKVVMGAVVAAAFAPELKAYVTSIDRGSAELDPLLGVADEEYNYDVFSVAGFINSNPIEEIEVTLDLTYQRRAYGEVDLGTVRSQPGNNDIQELIASATNANRTENWIIASLGASRLFLFDEPLLSIFSGVGLDASLTFNSVSASVKSYSYNSTSITVSAAAYF